MTFGKRIKQLRESRGITQVDLADKVGVSDKAVSTWENDTFMPRMGTIQKLATYFGVTKSFLIGDEPDPLPDLPNIVPLRRVQVPILGDIAAGEPVPAEEGFDEYTEIDASAPRCDYGLHVTSDSMEPTVCKGDLVFIRQQDDVDDGQIAAVLLDDSATLKRIFHIKGGLQLLSDNAAKYPPRLVTFDEYSTIKILGMAVAYRRNL